MTLRYCLTFLGMALRLPSVPLKELDGLGRRAHSLLLGALEGEVQQGGGLWPLAHLGLGRQDDLPTGRVALRHPTGGGPAGQALVRPPQTHRGARGAARARHAGGGAAPLPAPGHRRVPPHAARGVLPGGLQGAPRGAHEGGCLRRAAHLDHVREGDGHEQRPTRRSARCWRWARCRKPSRVGPNGTDVWAEMHQKENARVVNTILEAAQGIVARHAVNHMIILRALVPSVGYAWLRMSTTRRSDASSGA